MEAASPQEGLDKHAMLEHTLSGISNLKYCSETETKLCTFQPY